MSHFTILAIETSCDETSAAVFKNNRLLSNIVASQKIHEIYGGVVPELASRDHLKHIIPVVDQALQVAKINKNELTHIAYTQGPGLLGSLLVGSCFAHGLATGLKIPLIGIHHMKAHVMSNFIEEPVPDFPFLCLTVSGGHTQMVWVNSPINMTIIGQTLDDAVGEAFDKIAKLLGLPYPGGHIIDKLAQKGDKNRFSFPEPTVKDLNFSFSGCKTAVLYFLQKETEKNPNFIKENIHDICASVQHYLISILINKLKKAILVTKTKQIAIAGGVSANSCLRKETMKLGLQQNISVFIPQFEYCTDNAAMVACAAYYQLLYNATEKYYPIVKPRWDF
jgi:N6-L-threonylcarbamoyladenine synthase